MSVRAFDRGLDVLDTFDGAHPEQSIAGIAGRLDLDRATVRRLVLTLEHAGMLERSGGSWRLTPRVLDLGYRALAGVDFSDLALPYLRDVARVVDHSCSLGTLDDSAALFLARVPVRRVMSVDLARGARVAAHASAMGLALLSGLDDGDVAHWARRHGPLAVLTARTMTDPSELAARISHVRDCGWAEVDQEAEVGVRSVAAPVTRRDGRVVAAVSVGVNTDVVGLSELRERVLPVVVRAARAISADLGDHPVPLPGTPDAVAALVDH